MEKTGPMLNYLSNKNPHIRDMNISLDEATHIYNINGDTRICL